MRAVQSSSTAVGHESGVGGAEQFTALGETSRVGAGCEGAESLEVQREAWELLEAMRFCRRSLGDEEISAEERLHCAAALGVLQSRSFELVEQFVLALRWRNSLAGLRVAALEQGAAGWNAC